MYFLVSFVEIFVIIKRLDIGGLVQKLLSRTTPFYRAIDVTEIWLVMKDVIENIDSHRNGIFHFNVSHWSGLTVMAYHSCARITCRLDVILCCRNVFIDKEVWECKWDQWPPLNNRFLNIEDHCRGYKGDKRRLQWLCPGSYGMRLLPTFFTVVQRI